MMIQRFVEAADDCEAALAMDPTMVKLHVRRARCMLRMGMFYMVEEICNNVRSMMQPSVKPKVFSPDQDVDTAKVDATKCLKDLAAARQFTEHLSANESIFDFEGVLSVSESLTDICPQFKIAHTAKVRAYNKLQKWSEAKKYAEDVTCNSHVSLQKLSAHPEADLPAPSTKSLKWKVRNANSRSQSTQLEVNCNLVAKAILCMDPDLAQEYVNSLKNVDASHTCCPAVMEKMLLVLGNVADVCRVTGAGWKWIFDDVDRLKKMLNDKNSADTCFKAGKFQEASIKYSTVLKIDPNAVRWCAILHSNRAAAYMALAMNDEAVRDCNAAIAKDSSYARAYLRRARAFRSLNNYPNSVRDYRKYLSSMPTPPDYDEVNEELDDVQITAHKKAQADQRRQKEEKEREKANTWNSRGNPFTGGRSGRSSFEDDKDDFYEYFNSKDSRYNSGSSSSRGGNSGAGPYGTRGTSSRSRPGGGRPGPSFKNTESYFGNSAGGGGGYGGYGGKGGRNDRKLESDDDGVDHYNTLGVKNNATEVEIKKAYHGLALRYHPDKNSDPTAEDRFKDIGLAYAVLSNKAQRTTYDRTHY
jgi:tetratricopeptide (TPR) repeat protein